MKKSNFLRMALLIVVVALIYLVSARAVVVKHVFPRARLSQQLQYIIKPPYQIATPHRNVFRQLRVSLLPSVRAMAPPCNHAKAQATCCLYPFCHCVNGTCETSGCTIYQCTGLGIHAKSECYPGQGSGMCSGCENDTSDSNCIPQ